MSAMRQLSQTPSQTVGPFFSEALTPVPSNRFAPLLSQTMRISGVPAGPWLRGAVLDGNGEVVTDALLEAVQMRPEGAGLARSNTVSGGYAFQLAELPAQGGPAPWVDVVLFMRGLLDHLYTRVYFAQFEAANRNDPWFGRLEPELQERLLARRAGAGTYSFDIHLQGAHETPFLDV